MTTEKVIVEFDSVTVGDSKKTQPKSDSQKAAIEEVQQQYSPTSATTAADTRALNRSTNQTFQAGSAENAQTIGGRVTQERKNEFKIESPDGRAYHATTDKDGKMQSIQQIDRETGKPIGEPMKVTAERNGLPTAAEIKYNAEISKPSETVKHDSHEVKGNAESKGANQQDGKQVAPVEKAPQTEKAPQNEKLNPKDSPERGGASRDGVEPNKNQLDKGSMLPGASADSQKSQIRPDNIQASLPPSSEKLNDAHAEDKKRLAEHAAAGAREAESQKKFTESAPQLSPTFEQNRKTAEQFLARSKFDTPIPPRPLTVSESFNADLKNADIKRMFEVGDKAGTADGVGKRHADVIDKMDNATSKADAANFLDNKIGLLAAGIVNDRANRGADGRSGGGGGGGGASGKGAEDGGKTPGGKSPDGKFGSGERGVGTGSSEGTRDTARGGKDILPTEPTGKLKAQIENVDKLPTQKSQLAEMIGKYAEGKFTPKGDKESALLTAFQSIRFDQLKGIGAWLEDKTRNPFEFKMLDGQAQKTVSQIFDLVLGQAADRSGARGNQLNDGRGVKDSDASTVKIRDDKNIGARLDETVKLGGKIGTQTHLGNVEISRVLGEKTVKAVPGDGKPADSASGRAGAAQVQVDRTVKVEGSIKVDRTVKLDGNDKVGANKANNIDSQPAVSKGTKSESAQAKPNDTRADRAGASALDHTVKNPIDSTGSTRKIAETQKVDSTAKIEAGKQILDATGTAPARGAKQSDSDLTTDTRKVDASRLAKTFGAEKIGNEELRPQKPQLNDMMKRLVSTFRDENLTATITSRVADSSTSLKALKRKQHAEPIAKNEIIEDASAVKDELEEVMAHAPQIVLPAELGAPQDSDAKDAAQIEEQTKLERKNARFKTKGFTKTGTHRVMKGETYASIAKKYFDNESFAEIIFHYNKTASDIRPIMGTPGVVLALPKIGAYLKIPNKSAVWQFKLIGHDYSSYRFEVRQFTDAKEELEEALGENWSDRIEQLTYSARIVESKMQSGGSNEISISLQLNHKGAWLKIYEYKIFETETHVLKYTANGTFTKDKKSLPRKQSAEMAMNHFRNKFESLTNDFAGTVRT